MDSHSQGFLLSPPSLHPVYYQTKEDDGIIDLGLSLRTLQPQVYHPTGHTQRGRRLSGFGARRNVEGNKSNDLRNNCCNVLTIDAFESVGSLEGYGGYGEPVDWPQLEAQSRNSNSGCPKVIPEDCEEETEGVQSKERWAYVKVNMDGVVIGRKICVLDLAGYSSLALQLEDMFGRDSLSGLRLFQRESEFALFYKDREENWRTVGDVPWKEFVDSIKRLRIVRKNEAHFPSSLECT
ncbi:Auxin-responsive protein IAA32 [Vitis vinifera]|uniref:Auxin-responsive protein n=1 Tax=Vitis vinifera TaxID=29760 RepID=A0A438JTZ4_VITVI|nr:Auxin-responsive protein IAA32 [Vitis vinifera]